MKVTSTVVFLSVVGLKNVQATPSKYTYRSSGLQGSAYISGGQCGSWPFETYLDIYASKYTTKDNSNSKPGTQVFPWAYSYFNLWTDCTGTSASMIQPVFYDEPDPTTAIVNFPSTNKLDTGSASVTTPAIKVPCEIVTMNIDGEEWTWPEYSCDYTQGESVFVDIEVSWIGQGSTYQDRSTNLYRYSSGFSRWVSKGTFRDADVTPTIKVDGSPFTVELEYTYGSLSKSTSTSMEIYKYN
jgi:hypothetical protein